MRRVLILVEGQTEDRFIQKNLAVYLANKGIYLHSTILTTRSNRSGPNFKGGNDYGKIQSDLKKLLRDSNAVFVTTMFDFYGLPDNFPERTNVPPGTPYQRVAFLEEAFGKDINHSKFLPYLSLHEFEALLFVEPSKIAASFPGKNQDNLKNELIKIKTDFKNSPEEINDGLNTAPSKRLKSLIPEYQKTLNGSQIAFEITVDQMRNECPHFDA